MEGDLFLVGAKLEVFGSCTWSQLMLFVPKLKITKIHNWPSHYQSLSGEVPGRTVSVIMGEVWCSETWIQLLTPSLMLFSKSCPKWDHHVIHLPKSTQPTCRLKQLETGLHTNLSKSLFSHWVVSNSFAIPWTIARQAPLSMGFPRQEYWSGLPFPTPWDLPDPGIEPRSPISFLY